MTWRTTLHTLLEEGRWSNQQALVHALLDHGYQVTQATVSRELSALGASKQGGFYRLPPPTDLPAPLLSSAVAAGGGLVVLQTIPAHASVLAQAIDAAELKGVLGTVAGDDTVFVAVAGPEGIASLKRLTGRTP